MKFWAWDKKNLPSITHGIRTAVAATVSVIISRFVQMPEAYWAAIATLIVIQSTLGATLTLSVRELNEKIQERISGHGPIIVDLPLQEPSLTTSLLRH
jgi:hypothetical protein